MKEYSDLKVRVLLSLGYGAGLRVGEVVRLKVEHIDKAAAPPLLHLPPFRALALFRRLPSARVDGVVTQASENLHNCRRINRSIVRRRVV